MTTNVYGINPVLEALRAGRVTAIRARRGGARIEEISVLAAEQGVAVRWVEASELDRAARGGVHQGVVADLGAARDYSVSELVHSAAGVPLIVVLDGIEDPQNVGAIIRTADAAGVDGIIQQTRHAAALGGAVAKASAGALAHARVARVVNIARAIEELKQEGVWTVGLAGEALQSYDAIDLTVPVAFVFGGEGPGLRRLVRERCDWLVSIPMRGKVASLNVSAAAAVALFEAVRQRRAAGLG